MLRFLSKVAFLANLVFVVVFAMHWIKGTDKWDQDLVSHLVITAYFIATPLNIILNAFIIIFYAMRKSIPIEKWLQVVNALFLILQFIYFQFT